METLKEFYDLDGYFHDRMWMWDYDVMSPFLATLVMVDLL